MFSINVVDRGNLPSRYLSDMKKCLASCLASDPVSKEELRQELETRLSPEEEWRWRAIIVMEEWEIFPSGGNNYFIDILTPWGRTRAWAVRNKVQALQNICLNVVSKSLNSSDLECLRLPKMLKQRLNLGMPISGSGKKRTLRCGQCPRCVVRDRGWHNELMTTDYLSQFTIFTLSRFALKEKRGCRNTGLL